MSDPENLGFVSRRQILTAGSLFLSEQRAGVISDQGYDLVIRGGRVIDPESGYDRVADVGIRGDRVVLHSGRGLRGRRELNASGLVVAPGFVDILSNTHPDGDRYKIMDGVTTVLATHGGPTEVTAWLRKQADRKPLVHYGTVVGHFALRAEAGATDRNLPATPEQVRTMVARAQQAHQEGALGVGFGVEYIPGTSGEEVMQLAAVAADHRASVHSHIRLPHLLDPFQGINELIAAAAATGARVQVVHLGSMAIRRMKESLALIHRARKRGIDIAADVYPYDAWMTRLESALFDPGWQEKYSLEYHDLVWVATGERLTRESFEKYRKSGGHVACHQILESDIELALQDPLVSVASDGYIGEGPVSHPRGAGTFSRVLGRYVRERKVLSLTDALRKMTVQPVRRLETRAPALKRKGRLRPGMDADLVVFDPATIQDQATFQNPNQFSTGVHHVVVAGKVVVADGKFTDQPGAGRPIRGGSG